MEPNPDKPRGIQIQRGKPEIPNPKKQIRTEFQISISNAAQTTNQGKVKRLFSIRFKIVIKTIIAEFKNIIAQKTRISMLRD